MVGVYFAQSLEPFFQGSAVFGREYVLSARDGTHSLPIAFALAFGTRHETRERDDIHDVVQERAVVEVDGFGGAVFQIKVNGVAYVSILNRHETKVDGLLGTVRLVHVEVACCGQQ